MQKETTLTWRWFDQVWNRANENAIDEMLHPDAVVHGIEGITANGPAGFKVFHRDFLRDFSNLSVDVEEVVAENGLESCRCQVTATHNPSGQNVNFTGQTTVRIENGKIVEAWNNFDFLSMYRQLGFTLHAAAVTA